MSQFRKVACEVEQILTDSHLRFGIPIPDY